MEENKMKFNWRMLIRIGVVGALLFCLFKINNMSNEIANLQSQLSYWQTEASNLRNEISSIYMNVDEQLKKEASLLSNVDYTLGELDPATHSAKVNLKIVPKSITDDMQLSVKVGNNTVDFVRSGNEFTAAVSVNIFDSEQSPMLSIKTASDTKTESIEDIDLSYLYYQYLPVVDADIWGSSSYSGDKLKFEGSVSVDCKPSSPDCDIIISKVELVTELNGKEIARKDITSKLTDGHAEFSFEEKYSVKSDDELVMYVMAEDSAGYIHRTYTKYSLDGSGATGHSYTSNGNAVIYDKEGNILCGME